MSREEKGGSTASQKCTAGDAVGLIVCNVKGKRVRVDTIVTFSFFLFQLSKQKGGFMASKAKLSYLNYHSLNKAGNFNYLENF